MLIDTHCHLDFYKFDNDRDKVVSRAKTAGITHILNPGLNLSSSQRALKLSEKFPEVFAAVGVHPNDSSMWENGTESSLRKIAGHPKVVAIGEIGLDYYRDRSPQDVQVHVFRKQLELADELDKPVIIHVRDPNDGEHKAMQEVIKILVNWLDGVSRNTPSLLEHPGVLHSFSGDEKAARQAIELNFFLGFTGPVTYPKADQLRSVVASVPLEDILIETDAPFLTPQQFRGKRNEPAHVKYIADKIAQIHGTSLEEVGDITSENATRLFNWPATQ